MIGVNLIGHESKKLKAVMEKEKLTWRSFTDPGGLGKGSIAARWNLTATPTFYLIDHRGVIRRKWVGGPGGKALDTALEKLIREAEGEPKDSKPGKD